jgi:hypothetical protein
LAHVYPLSGILFSGAKWQPWQNLSTYALSDRVLYPFANTQHEQHHMSHLFNHVYCCLAFNHGRGICASCDVADAVREVVPGLRACRLARLQCRGAPNGRRASADVRSSTHWPTACAKIPVPLIFRFFNLVSSRFSNRGFRLRISGAHRYIEYLSATHYFHSIIL